MLFLVAYDPKTTAVDLTPILERATPHEVIPILRNQLWLVQHPNVRSADDLLILIQTQAGQLADNRFFVSEVGGEPACSHSIANRVIIGHNYASSARGFR